MELSIGCLLPIAFFAILIANLFDTDLVTTFLVILVGSVALLVIGSLDFKR